MIVYHVHGEGLTHKKNGKRKGERFSEKARKAQKIAKSQGRSSWPRGHRGNPGKK